MKITEGKEEIIDGNKFVLFSIDFEQNNHDQEIYKNILEQSKKEGKDPSIFLQDRIKELVEAISLPALKKYSKCKKGYWKGNRKIRK